jgi:hypothetical protein
MNAYGSHNGDTIQIHDQLTYPASFKITNNNVIIKFQYIGTVAVVVVVAIY